MYLKHFAQIFLNNETLFKLTIISVVQRRLARSQDDTEITIQNVR